MSVWNYQASPDAVKELLDGGGEFLPPADLLNDLSGEQATVTPPGAPYSIAQIVAHIHFYQNANIAAARGEAWPKPQHLEDTFAHVAPEDWPVLVADFLTGIQTCKSLAEEKANVTSPAREDTALTYDLAESALHNAYHLGQVVLLRRMLGLWPPASGDQNDF